MTNHKVKPGISVTIACLAALVAGWALLPRVFDRHPPSPEPAAQQTVGLVVPPGSNLITVHGLTITVPASWHQVTGHPCIVDTDLVMLPVSSMPGCVPGRAKNVSTVEFFERQLGTRFVAGTLPTEVRIDATAATRASFADVRAHYLVIWVPSLQVSVEIGAPTAAGAERLAATLRITGGDAHGCPSKAAGRYDLKALSPAVRGEADRSLLPDGANTVTLCRYQDGWLEQGASVPAPKLASFIAGMNALPAGLSKASDHEGQACHSGSDDSENLTGQSVLDSAGYLVFADYPSGPAVTVVVRLALCGKLGASNGSRTAQRTGQLISLITALGGNGPGYPDKVTRA